MFFGAGLSSLFIILILEGQYSQVINEPDNQTWYIAVLSDSLAFLQRHNTTAQNVYSIKAMEIYWPYPWSSLFWFLEIPEIQMQNFLLYHKKVQRDQDNMCSGYKQ